MRDKIIEFYNNFLKSYSNIEYDRCLLEHYRNELSKLFNIPCGHRWKFEDWFMIQKIGFGLLLNDGKISKSEFEFYTKRINF